MTYFYNILSMNPFSSIKKMKLNFFDKCKFSYFIFFCQITKRCNKTKLLKIYFLYWNFQGSWSMGGSYGIEQFGLSAEYQSKGDKIRDRGDPKP